jgi:hypothetical protein
MKAAITGWVQDFSILPHHLCRSAGGISASEPREEKNTFSGTQVL